MTVTDPIADMLTRIRNAISVRHDSVQIPASNVKTEIAGILKSDGVLEIFSAADNTLPSFEKILLILIIEYSCL